MKSDSIQTSSLEAAQSRNKQRANDGETKGTTKCNVTNYIVILASCGQHRMLLHSTVGNSPVAAPEFPEQ